MVGSSVRLYHHNDESGNDGGEGDVVGDGSGNGNGNRGGDDDDNNDGGGGVCGDDDDNGQATMIGQQHKDVGCGRRCGRQG